MNYGFLKTACCSPKVSVASPKENAGYILESVKDAYEKGARLIVCPELCITGYTCGDLFFQKSLQEQSLLALEDILSKTKDIKALVFVGLPLCLNDGIYNVAAVLFEGKLLAFVPKSYMPNYGEFYERRQFKPFGYGRKTEIINTGSFKKIPFGTNIIFRDVTDSALSVACEICEDLWVPLSPGIFHALNGASILCNLSSGNEVIGKAEYRRNLVKSRSGTQVCAYLYANSSKGESTQDMVFASHNLICENGSILAESSLFSGETVFAQVDYQRLSYERQKMSTFFDCAENHRGDYTFIDIDLVKDLEKKKLEKLERFVDPHPFVPSGEKERSQRCSAVVELQSQGLAKRLSHINCKSAVIGLSGGLDSTLALLVTARAFDLCGISRSCIQAVTMPCFGTTDRTYNNACTLARETGATLTEVNIAESVRLHFKDIGHDENTHDVTYENCQARERTQVLMDLANKTQGIVIGTGDLSELALGWCTYNGDHMSMYGVNSSIPKTLVRYLVEWFALEEKKKGNKNCADVLFDILDTPVSPELLPPEDGKISQKTEDLVGPYELHDFVLYYVLRFGFTPEKIAFLAKSSGLPYDEETVEKWMKVFYRRFTNQQFKRSCMPDGAKVGTVNLSPRGDWRMPSDSSFNPY